VRTTVRLDDGLLKEAKALAARSGRTLTDLIEEALRESLARQRRPPLGRVELPTFRGEGLQPGVDLDDSSALADLMEGERP
jgi:hypothetical protein